MKIELTFKEKEELELQHSKERDGRVRDRIKAVLLNTEGWTQKQIAQALRIRYETVQDHLNDYKKSKKLKPENGGSQSHLTPVSLAVQNSPRVVGENSPTPDGGRKHVKGKQN